MTEKLSCQTCGKRLSRKTARMIDGVVMCSPCMFGQSPRDSDRLPEGENSRSEVECEASQSGGGNAASPTPSALSSTPPLEKEQNK